MDFRNWILEAFTPVVMVIPSREAESSVADRNGLTIVDLLRPYGYFHHLSVPVRTVGDQAYRIKEFKLRFYNSQHMYPPQNQEANAYLDRVLTEATSKLSTDHVADIPASLSKGQLETRMPWFEGYKREFLRTLAFADHETYDYPVACLLVMHAHVADPLQAYSELFKSATLPPLMRQGIMEPQVLKHYLLLHDDAAAAATGGFARSEEKLRQMQQSLGPASCHLLRINTGKAGSSSNAGYDGLWRAHIKGTLPGGGAGEPQARPPVPPGGYGASLSPADVEGVSKFLEEFTVRVLLPYLEVRVRNLNHQVTVSRRGLRNQLKTFLFRQRSSAAETPRAGAGGTPGGSDYGAGTTEGQMRQLADLAFLMQDHETAASTLKLLVSDYKTDKAWKHLAGAQEMLALSLFMTGGAMNDVTALLKEAFFRYNSVNPLQPKACVRFATRSMLILADYCRQHGAYSDAHSALMRAHSQESDNVRSGLLLEQAGMQLLQIHPPALRKYAFNIVLAGLKYLNHSQRTLGIRCYLQALSVYKGQSWGFIEEHIHDTLGRSFREAGNLLGAVHHFMAILPCPQATPALQGRYLQQFLDAVRSASAAQEKPLVLQLSLPVVDIAHAHAVFDDQYSHANAAALTFPESHWRQLEQPFLAGSESNLTSWLDGGSKANLALQQHNTAVAGELIGVEVQMSNPMAIGLSLTHLRAVYEHESGATGAANDFVQVMEQELVIKPGDTEVACLSVLPLKPGLIRLVGLEWVLNGQAQGRQMFAAAKAPSHRRSGSRLPLQSKVNRSANQCLSFNVIPAAPKLEVELLQRPGSMLDGGLHRCCLSLRNSGASPLHNVRMIVSHPDVYCPTSDADLESDVATALSASDRQSGSTSTSGSSEEHSISLKGGQTLFVWGPKSSLQPQGTLQWPLWLHPRSPGLFTFHCAWYYEPSSPVEGLKFRLLRMTQSMEVLPSLSIVPRLTPCSDSLHRSLLQLTISRAQGKGPITLQQVTSSSPNWSLSELGPESRQQAHQEESTSSSAPCQAVLQPQSQASLFFYLHHCQRPLDAAGISGSISNAAGPVRHFHSHHSTLQLHTAPAATPEGAVAPPLPPPQPGPDLLLSWQDARGHPGMHHVYNCQHQVGGPVRLVSHAQAVLQHNFQADPMCPVTVQLSFCNLLQSPVTLCIEAGRQADLPEVQNVPGAWQPLAQPEAEEQQTPSRLTPRPSLDPSLTSGRVTPRGTADLPPGRDTPRVSAGTVSGRSTPRRTAEAPAAVTPSMLPPMVDSAQRQQDLLPTADYIWCGQSRTSLPPLGPHQCSSVQLHVVVFQAGVCRVSEYAVVWTYPELGNLSGTLPGPAVTFQIN